MAARNNKSDKFKLVFFTNDLSNSWSVPGDYRDLVHMAEVNMLDDLMECSGKEFCGVRFSPDYSVKIKNKLHLEDGTDYDIVSEYRIMDPDNEPVPSFVKDIDDFVSIKLPKIKSMADELELLSVDSNRRYHFRFEDEEFISEEIFAWVSDDDARKSAALLIAHIIYEERYVRDVQKTEIKLGDNVKKFMNDKERSHVKDGLLFE